ncbi:transcriptional regulator [Brevundimonas sp.]|uniref:transcriptional regulator n=1 Tax=Brevundimonas sp. TaxID=1871086 RepID=UPI0025D1502A|nr:transcriptional regulator [Brevundimonas sp.]
MIDNSYLLGLFGGGYLPSAGGVLSGSSTASKTPTAPWSTRATPPEPDALVRAALGGRDFIDLRAPRLDVKDAAEDYRRLFALNQGLTTLNALVNRADTKGITFGELGRLEKAFQAGLTEISQFLSDDPFESIRVAKGASASEAKGKVGAPRSDNSYVTKALHAGDPDLPAAALEGDVRFTMTVRKLSGDVDVNIDLNDMGATPRTLSNVVIHLNAQLEAAGVQTRIAREKLPSEPRTITVSGKSVTLPAGPDRYALRVKGVSVETLSFSAADRSDGVFVLQASGAAGTPELSKFTTDTGVTGAGAPAAQSGVGDTLWVEGRSLQTPLADGLKVKASASGPDGSLYVLAEATAAVDGQAIKGGRDAVLMKYDSAGKVVFTRTLGAADQASANAIAVSADGKVAIAGSVTGALDKGVSGVDARLSDSFVTVFDAEGSELWSQRRGANLEDEALGVAFGDDGAVYVAGRSRSAMTGGAPVGGWDGYLQGFSVQGSATFVKQFGTTADDAVSALAVADGAIVTAGVENGQAILRRFELQPAGAPVLAQTRDLGALSGSIAGVALDAGRVLLTGTTRNAALDAGTVTSGHSGGSDAFVARLDDSLVADAADRLTFVGGTGTDGASAATVSGGKVWITGQTNLQGTGDKQTATGYVSRVDPETGAVEWTRDFEATGGLVAPISVAVTSGASVLDRLGLPQGEIDFSPSKSVVDATSARVGDQLFVDRGGGRLRPVTIEARDTFASLARKIAIASDNRLKAEVVKSDNRDVIRISPRDERTAVEIVAGPAGRDALEALGLSQTLVRPVTGSADGRDVFALKLPADLSLRDKAAIKSAGEAIQAAMSQIRSAYRALADKDRPASARITGQAPAHVTAQIANYQAALSRLTGGG